MEPIALRLQEIRAEIHAACQRSGRDPERVRIMAVSKTRTVQEIRAAAEAGLRLFGENRVQEAADKIPQLADLPLEWHLIGPLQKNKVKPALGLFGMIQAVDSLELAAEISRRNDPDQPMSVLLQVNLGAEPQKHGVDPSTTETTLRAMAGMPGITVRGLMTVPPFWPDPEAVRPFFRALNRLADEIHQLHLPGVSMAERSMGMSHDYAVAVEEGSTLVRIGSALFGPRDYP